VRVGKDWYLLRHGMLIKRYPACYFIHRSFEATVKMLGGRRLGPDDIAGIEVTMGRGQTTVLVNERPQTGLEAKFSGQFAMAAAVILGRMGVAEFADEIVQRADIQAVFPKVKLKPVDEYDARDPVHGPTERVVIKLKNGEVYDTGTVGNIRGHADDPLSTEELWTKFAECTAQTHAEPEARRLFNLLQAVETLPGVRDLPTCETIFRS